MGPVQLTKAELEHLLGTAIVSVSNRGVLVQVISDTTQI
jgi:hypothetical protein